MKWKKAKQGSSLLVSLLALSLVTMISIKIFTGVEHQGKILTSTLEQDKVIMYLQAGEAWAEHILLTDTLEIDDKTQVMAADFELEDGHLFINLIDLQSCLNVNALAEETLKERMRTQLYLLSDSLMVEDYDWVDVVSDWIDADEESEEYGKESSYYLTMETPYKAANAPMVSDYEWNMLDISSEGFEELMPYLCSLPFSATKLNINTVSTTVLKSILPKITDSQITYIHDLIEGGEAESITSLTSNLVLSSLSWVESDWSVGTQFIAVVVRLQKEGKNFWLHTEMAKSNDGIVKPYFRSMMEPTDIVKARFSIKDILNES